MGGHPCRHERQSLLSHNVQAWNEVPTLSWIISFIDCTIPGALVLLKSIILFLSFEIISLIAKWKICIAILPFSDRHHCHLNVLGSTRPGLFDSSYLLHRSRCTRCPGLIKIYGYSSFFWDHITNSKVENLCRYFAASWSPLVHHNTAIIGRRDWHHTCWAGSQVVSVPDFQADEWIIMSSQCVLIERCKYTPSQLKHSPICCLNIPNQLLYDWRTSSAAGSYVACLNSTINGRIQISQENERIEGLLRRKAGVLYSGIREANRQKNSTKKNKLLSKEYVLTVSTRIITLAL